MYSISWTQGALEDVAEIWLKGSGPERQRITDSVHQLDSLLTESPLDVGESREGDVRVAFVAPVAISYQVEVASHEVIVLSAWSYRTRN